MLGIDIQPHLIRLVQLQPKKQGFLIDWIKTTPLHPSEDSKSHWQQIALTLKQLLPSTKKNQPACIALPANLTKMQTFSLPIGLTDHEIKKEIETYVKHDFPEPKSNLCIDFNTRPNKATGYADIFFAAVKEEVLKQYMTCLELAGLAIQYIDIDLLVINRMILLLIPHLLQKKYLALYCTDDRAILFAIHHQDLVQYQVWSFTEMEDKSFYTQLETHLQFYLNNHSKNHATYLVICTEQAHTKRALQELAIKYHLDVYYLYLLQQLFFNIDEILPISQQPLNFLLALGLATCKIR